LAGLAGPLSELLELASWAAEQGFDAVMVHEPGDPGGSAGGLVALLHAVADESPLPVVPYVRTPRLADVGLRAVVDQCVTGLATTGDRDPTPSGDGSHGP